MTDIHDFRFISDVHPDERSIIAVQPGTSMPSVLVVWGSAKPWMRQDRMQRAVSVREANEHPILLDSLPVVVDFAVVSRLHHLAQNLAEDNFDAEKRIKFLETKLAEAAQ